MATLDLLGTRLDLYQEPGDDTAIDLTMLDASGEPMDLSGWSFAAPIVGTDSAFTVEISGNVVSLALAKDTVPPGRSHRWALVGTSGDQVTTWLSGTFLATDSPTRRPTSGELTVAVGEPTVTVSVSLAGSGLPAGGEVGQVLTWTADGPAWVTPTSPGPTFTADPDHPGLWIVSGLTEDPDHPGLFEPGPLVEDPDHAGLYLIPGG